MTLNPGVVFVMGLFVGSAAAQTPAAVDAVSAPTLSEDSFVKGLYLPADAQVIYKDQAGAEIEFDRFFGRVILGEAFGIDKDAAQNRVVLKIGSRMTDPSLMPSNAEFDPNAPLGPWELRNVDDQLLHGPGGTDKPILFSFFFADCAPCIEEVPVLNALAAEEMGIELAAVTFETREEARAFATVHALSWPVYFGGQSFLDAMGVRVYPSFAVMSADGRVLDVTSSPKLFGLDGPDVDVLKRWVSATLR